MLSFWKKNEREERELRRKAEKDALDQLRIEEEQREARRQQRKLDLLITQTELYGHFISGKLHGEALPEVKKAGLEKEEVDFDSDNEETLRERARLSAAQALAINDERTRLFDEGVKKRRLEAGISNSTQKDCMFFYYRTILRFRLSE